MGFGATHGCWGPQLEELLGSKTVRGPPRARVLLLDNRGVGRSESPLSRKAYTTTIMATDIICILVSFQYWEISKDLGDFATLSSHPRRISTCELGLCTHRQRDRTCCQMLYFSEVCKTF